MKHLVALLNRFRPLALALLRVVTGLLFLEHGLQKVFGFPQQGPASLSGLILVAAILETNGALLVTIGLYTRLFAFLLSGEMAFAYFMAHAPKSFFPLLNGGESAILFCFVFFYLIFAGGGALSVDRVWLKQD